MNCTCELSKCLSPGAKDLTIFKANISLLNKLLKHFTPCFSKKTNGSVYSRHLRLIQETLWMQWLRQLIPIIRSSNPHFYEDKYFFSDSAWDLPAIKRKRLEIIQKQRTTASTKNGLLAIDDTGRPKPFAKKTQGAKWQYCGPLKREEVCNVGVCVAFVSKTKHFPIDIVPYLPADEFPGGKSNPHFKDKLHIAQELFDKSLKTIEFSAVTFDSWYATTDLLEHIHTRKKIFFSEINMSS